ncbi:MAG: helix-turn-helix domain-containing protein, partial [Actinobacteria bacterium]|nr:helix-turn-helix domain-containing protein [Actinomycetota bacterium]
PHGVQPPYLLAVSQSGSPRLALKRAHEALTAKALPGLAAISDEQVLILSEEGEPLEQVLDALAFEDTRIGVSTPFETLDELPSALLQARSALIRNQHAGKVLRFVEHEATSLFLPQDPIRLQAIATQVLGPLRTYDQQRGTSLTQTLRVFLEENRSWVRASERLFVHRQTLIARISRIEKIIDRDLSSMEDTAECWLAVQAAISCGDLEPSEPPASPISPEE